MGAGFIRAGCAVIARTSCKATTRHQVQGANRERTSSGVPRLHDGHPQAERPPRTTRSIDRREAMSPLCMVGVHLRRGWAFVGSSWHSDLYIRVCRDCGQQVYDRKSPGSST